MPRNAEEAFEDWKAKRATASEKTSFLCAGIELLNLFAQVPQDPLIQTGEGHLVMELHEEEGIKSFTGSYEEACKLVEKLHALTLPSVIRNLVHKATQAGADELMESKYLLAVAVRPAEAPTHIEELGAWLDTCFTKAKVAEGAKMASKVFAIKSKKDQQWPSIGLL